MAKKKRGVKKTAYGAKPSTKKRVGIPHFESEKDAIHLSFFWFDITYPGQKSSIDFSEIARKFQSYEKMTWGQLAGDKRNNHPIDTNILPSKSKEALITIGRDDLDHLWSLRLTGVQRIWGFRYKNHMMILWWDPEHNVYQTPKKRT